LFSVLLSHSFK